jgi:hypothetical protein
MMVAGIDRDATRQDRNHDPDDPEDDNFELARREHSVVLIMCHPDNEIRGLLFARRQVAGVARSRNPGGRARSDPVNFSSCSAMSPATVCGRTIGWLGP